LDAATPAIRALIAPVTPCRHSTVVWRANPLVADAALAASATINLRLSSMKSGCYGRW
jgi:hypothetical protein